MSTVPQTYSRCAMLPHRSVALSLLRSACGAPETPSAGAASSLLQRELSAGKGIAGALRHHSSVAPV